MTRFLRRLAWPAAAASGVAVIYGSFFVPGSDWRSLVLSALFAVAFMVGCVWALDRRDASYSQRIAADEAVQWEVWLNGVMLGNLTDAEYATYQQHACRDGGHVIDQLMNDFSALRRLAWWAASSVAVIAFWAGVVAAIAAPEAFLAAVRELLRDDVAGRAVRDLRMIGMNASLILLLVLFVAVGGGANRFGLRNCHSEAVGRMLRKRFKTPAEGQVFVFPVVSEQAAERAFVRA